MHPCPLLKFQVAGCCRLLQSVAVNCSLLQSLFAQSPTYMDITDTYSHQHTHTHTHAHVHARTHTQTHDTHTHKHTHFLTHAHIHTYTHTHTRIHTHSHTKSSVGREILVADTERAVSKRQNLQALGEAIPLLYVVCYKLFFEMVLCNLYLTRIDMTQGLFYLTLSYLLFDTNCTVVITQYWSSKHFYHQ